MPTTLRSRSPLARFATCELPLLAVRCARQGRRQYARHNTACRGRTRHHQPGRQRIHGHRAARRRPGSAMSWVQPSQRMSGASSRGMPRTTVDRRRQRERYGCWRSSLEAGAATGIWTRSCIRRSGRVRHLPPSLSLVQTGACRHARVMRTRTPRIAHRGWRRAGRMLGCWPRSAPETSDEKRKRRRSWPRRRHKQQQQQEEVGAEKAQEDLRHGPRAEERQPFDWTRARHAASATARRASAPAAVAHLRRCPRSTAERRQSGARKPSTSRRSGRGRSQSRGRRRSSTGSRRGGRIWKTMQAGMSCGSGHPRTRFGSACRTSPIAAVPLG